MKQKGHSDKISDYIKLYKEIYNTPSVLKAKDYKTIKVAVLSSFTIQGLKEVLFIKCYENRILPEIYIGEYNQYSQEILYPESQLYKFDPDLIIIFIDTRAVFGDKYLQPYLFSDNQRKNFINEKLSEIKILINKIQENSKAKILLHNFDIPLYSPLGIVENKQNFGFIESIEILNLKLKNVYKTDNQTYIFDYNSFCSKVGKDNIIDYKMYYLGDIKIDWNYLPELCYNYISYIKPLLSLTKKCIVLDLDNTLWGGIIGEEGLEGIKLGPTSEGRPFVEFQKYLLSLFSRGIILAVNSKNNYDDAIQVFIEHPYMILKEKHFASMQINWNDKISNMKAIAQEINIGTDSLVFFDDDKLNREIIKKALPEVLVVDLPDDPSLYLKTLMELNDFNILQITDEDKKKGKMYAEQRKRSELLVVASDITEYLKTLGITVKIEKANNFTIPRISQLTQKTNQFNLTTKRYLEEDIKKFASDENYLVISAKVEDKFGDNGITGLAIIEKDHNRWFIDTFLLSCRVIGRKIEETILAYIIEQAKKENAKILEGEFIPTKKNIPAKDFFKNNNFKLINKNNNNEIWQYNIIKGYNYPDIIKVIY